MKTILYGNGFNRLSNGNSWEELVHAIDDSNDVDKENYKYRIPNTLQYEVKALTKTGLKEDIASEMLLYNGNSLFVELLNLDVDHIMTTNYDYVPDDIFEKELGYIEDKSERDKSEAMFSIHRKKCFQSGTGKSKFLWKIHGELSNPRSIMLGYEHYCSYVGHIKKYISGEYNFAKRGKEEKIPKLDDRLNDMSNFEILSWIDLFFISDIYIVGFGLYYDEIDLWWLLTLRKQKLDNSKISKNRIVFYGECMPGKKELLESLGVEVYTPKAPDFPGKYKECINDIKNR